MLPGGNLRHRPEVHLIAHWTREAWLVAGHTLLTPPTHVSHTRSYYYYYFELHTQGHHTGDRMGSRPHMLPLPT